MPSFGTDLMEIHAIVHPSDIVKALEKNRARYVKTLGDVKDIYEAQTERYAKAYREYTQKEINGELTEAEKKAKPVEPRMPPDRTKQYDRLITLYKATLEVEVYLNVEHFGEFFLDEWDFIRTHISHLRLMRAGAGFPGVWASADAAIAISALAASEA